MSNFSRAQADHLSPDQADADIHPWSEELCGILTDAGLDQQHIDHCTALFDKALEADPVVVISYGDLLQMASSCTEFNEQRATFWSRLDQAPRTVRGSTFEETLSEAINYAWNQDGTDDANAIAEYLLQTAGLQGEALDKAWKILSRLRHQYLFNGQPPPSADTGLEPITSGKLEWHVLHCPGWPAGIDFSTRGQALDHISASGDDRTQLASWWHQANRVDYTPEQLARMLAEHAQQGGMKS